MKTGTKLVIISVAVLCAAVAVFAFLNRENIAAKKEAQEGGFFYFYAGDEEHTVTMEDIEALSPSVIKANYKKNGKESETRYYSGVSLRSVAESLGIDVSGYSSAAFSAADGYASALTITEAMDGENCCIVIAMGGEPLGTKEGGGSGPFMMILPNDQFSQRWCKFLIEVRLK